MDHPMNVLITTLGLQDPFRKAAGRIDYSRDSVELKEIWRQDLVSLRRGDSSHAYKAGPVISAIAAMKAGRTNEGEGNGASRGQPWTPDEVVIVYRNDSKSQEIGPVEMRREALTVFLQREQITVTPVPIAQSAHDYHGFWTGVSASLSPILKFNQKEGKSVRILVGMGTNPVRMALLHLGLLHRASGVEIWLSVDQDLAGPGYCACHPYLVGEDFYPELVPSSEVENRDREIARLRQALEERSLGGLAVGAQAASPESVRRVMAQQVLDSLVADPDAPIWTDSGDIHRQKLRQELSRRLEAVGIAASPETIRRWLSDGRLPQEERQKKEMHLSLYEVLRPLPARS
jgi:hypothetical protein